MSTRYLPLLLTTMLSVPALAQTGYHLWYDENGQAVYSQFAPSDRPSELVKPPPPPAESPEVAQQRLDQRMQQFADQREDEELAKEKSTAAEVEAEQKQQRCQAAKQNLIALNGPPNRLYQTADGVRRLTVDERQTQRAEAEKIVAENCT